MGSCFGSTDRNGPSCTCARPTWAQTVWSDSSVENGQAYHLVLTQRGDVSVIYVNGIASQVTKAKPAAGGDTPLTISSASQAFAGLIYEVALYKLALGEEEVISLFHQGRERYGLEVDPWKAPVTDNAAAAWHSLPRSMHLSRPPAGWVVTSSNGDFTNMYSESAIDGNLNTAWRSFLPTTDEWVDLAWDFPMTVDRVNVLPHESSELNEFEWFGAWQRDRWVSIAKHRSDGQPYTFSFDPVQTERVRSVMKESPSPGLCVYPRDRDVWPRTAAGDDR